MMPGLVVDWVTLSTPEFVGWTRVAGVRLPFPLSTSDVPYVEAPERAEIERMIGTRGLDESPVLAAARAAFADPRLVVYAVRVSPEGEETKYVSVAAHDEHAVFVQLDRRTVSLRSIGDTELAAAVVGSLPQVPVLRAPSVEVPVRGLQAVDAAVAAGESPRTVHAALSAAGLPPALAVLHDRAAGQPGTSGSLGAVVVGEPARHSTRSATWREFADGGLLQVERGSRAGEPVVLLAALTPDALFRAAVDAISSAYEGRST